MQSAETVLDVLRERGRHGLPLDELYRQLFNPQLYLLAYGRIYSNKGAMTPGPDAETADGMTLGKIERIIDALRHERYRFKPVRRHYIPKKDGKQRPLGLPSWSDKLVGEVVRLLLRRTTSRSSPTAPTVTDPPVVVTPRSARWRSIGRERPGLSKVTSHTASTSLTIRSCSTRWVRRSTITGSFGWSARCCEPGTWRTGCGTPRSAVRRRAGFSPRACPTSTWTGWTSSSRRFCCRNTPEVCSGVPTLSTTGSAARSIVPANVVIKPRCGRCASSGAAYRQGIHVILAIGGFVTSGTRTYADIWISPLMPSVALCRGPVRIACGCRVWRRKARHNHSASRNASRVSGGR